MAKLKIPEISMEIWECMVAITTKTPSNCINGDAIRMKNNLPLNYIQEGRQNWVWQLRGYNCNEHGLHGKITKATMEMKAEEQTGYPAKSTTYSYSLKSLKGTLHLIRNSTYFLLTWTRYMILVKLCHTIGTTTINVGLIKAIKDLYTYCFPSIQRYHTAPDLT